MRPNTILAAALIGILLSTANGCSYRGWYDNFQLQQERECDKINNRDERELCKDKLKSYDQYQQDRKEVIEQTP